MTPLPLKSSPYRNLNRQVGKAIHRYDMISQGDRILVGMSGGMTGKEAAIQSSRELRIPLLTASLTTSAAFLPIFLAESATGEAGDAGGR